MVTFVLPFRKSLCMLLGLTLVPALNLSGQELKNPRPIKPSAKAGQSAPKPAEQPAVKVPAEDLAQQSKDQPEPAAPVLTKQQMADDQLIREQGQAFIAAYNSADAKAVTAHFANDAEYVDEHGNVTLGRTSISECLASFFASNPGCKLTMETKSLRFISPNVVIEDGTSSVIRKDDPNPFETEYTAIYVKTDGKWLAASIRDHAPLDRRQHRTQLEQLDWLTGDWVDESDEALVDFSGKLTEGGNFLVRDFTIHVAGQAAMSGTQRIGWDPLTGKLRMWFFDSEGGYGEGNWYRNDENWILKLTGVTADGEPASSTCIYTVINSHTITWQIVDHEIAGHSLPDSEVITIVRRAPTPVPLDLTVTP